MTTPWPRQTEFAALRQAVSGAAARVLETQHPEYVLRYRTAVGEGADINRALDAAGRLPTDSPFATWRRILTAFVEQEMHTTQLRTALYLLRTAAPPDLQDATGALQGAWVVYHTQAALSWLAASVESARRLVSMLYRTCVRPFDAGWTARSAIALRPLADLSARVEALRERLRDDGWTARQLEREQIWDGSVLGTTAPGTWAVWYYAAQFRKQWVRELDNLARQLTFTLERICARLLAEIPWEALA